MSLKRFLFFLAPCLAATTQAQLVRTDHGRLGQWIQSHGGPVSEETIELEKPDDVYARSPLTGLLRVPSTSISWGKYVSRQVNVDGQGNNIVGDAANEPSMAIDPNNRNRITIGWRQFDSVTSNFRQAGNAYSVNGGQSFRSLDVLQRGVFRSDPVLCADAGGYFFYNSLKQTFYDDIWGSQNGGLQWLFQGEATGGDKQWMAIDTTTSTGRGNMYQCWSTAGNNYNGRQFSRSTDGGFTWADPLNIPGSPFWGTLDLAKNGDLYICGVGSPFQFIRSTDAKDKTKTPTFENPVQVNLGGSIVFGSAVNPAGLMGQTWIAADRSTRSTKGNIYMLASVAVDTANPCQIGFARSTDGGQTWSAPKILNDDPKDKGANHWFGTLSVAPNGRIDACWNDTRQDPTSSLSSLYYTSSRDGGLTWSKNERISPRFNPNIGYPNQDKMGDYMGMVSDNAGANIVYAATFNGEEDIWFVRVPSPPDIAVSATAIVMHQGMVAKGTVEGVWAIDNSAHVITSRNITGLGQASAALASYQLPVSDSTALAVRLRAKTTAEGTGIVWFYNWATSKYDLVQAFPMHANTPVSVTTPATATASPYSNGGLVRVLFRALSPLGTPPPEPFLLRTDLLELLYQ